MDDVDRIKEQLDIVSFINEYVPLKKAGKNFKANCPFHGESSPSFFVSGERGAWHCFGCGLGGDIFSFLMEYEKIDFQESLRILAKRAGITLAGTRSSGYSKKELYYSINQAASTFYNYLLTEHNAGKKALAYLNNRGVNEHLIKTFKIGYAPIKKTALIDYLIEKKGFEIIDLETIGLASRRNNGVYDFFTDRIMFPLIDHRDNTVGFSGRQLVDNKFSPKYINTKETPIYHKGEHFFGINTAIDIIRKEEKVLIVEGEFDVISVYSEGIKNVIAVKGTALTKMQSDFLARYVKKVVLCFDQDKPGLDAMVKSLPTLESSSLLISVLPFNQKDPDEAIKSDPYAFKKQFIHDQNIYDYLIEIYSKDIDKNNIEEKMNALEKLLSILVNIKNQIMLEHYLKKLSNIFDISLESIKKELPKQSQIYSEVKKDTKDKQKRSGLEVTTEYFCALLFQNVDIELKLKKIDSNFLNLLNDRNAYEKLLRYFFDFNKLNTQYDNAKFESFLPSELVEAYTNTMLFPLEIDKKSIENELIKTFKKLHQLLIKQSLVDISEKINLKEKNNQPTEDLHQEYLNVLKLSKQV